MIINAKVTGMTVKTKGKGEDLTVGAKLTLEVDEADQWELDALASAMDGGPHEVAIDEHVAIRRTTAQ